MKSRRAKDPAQLDLFAAPPLAPAHAAPPSAPAHAAPEPARPGALEDLSEAALSAALAEAVLDDARALAAEAGRRRLEPAVPALEALCRRFAGFGREHAIPEQVAALLALREIGGRAAAAAVARTIAIGVFTGPNLAAAVAAAAALGVELTPAIAEPLLRSADPAVRAAACDCARASGGCAAALIDLLSDRDGAVAAAAACALGRAGRPEALRPLKGVLAARPSPRAIAALACVADEEAVILIGRLGGERPDLAEAVLAALDEIEHSKAAVIAQTLRNARAGRGRP